MPWVYNPNNQQTEWRPEPTPAPSTIGATGGATAGATRGQDWVNQMRKNAIVKKRPKYSTRATAGGRAAIPPITVQPGEDSWLKMAARLKVDPGELARANGDVLTLHPGMVLKLPRPLQPPVPTPYAPTGGGFDPSQYNNRTQTAVGNEDYGLRHPAPPTGGTQGTAGATDAFGRALNAFGYQPKPGGGYMPSNNPIPGAPGTSTPAQRGRPVGFVEKNQNVQPAYSHAYNQIEAGIKPIIIMSNDPIISGLTSEELIAAGYTLEPNGNFWVLGNPVGEVPTTGGGGGGGGFGYSRGGGGGGGGGGGNTWATPYSPYTMGAASGRTLDSLSQGLITWRI